MFTDTHAFSGFAVPDTAAVRGFYADTLGLRVVDEPMGHGLISLHLEGGTVVLVYPKPDHVPATFTVLNFPVDDVDAAVDELVARGVEMLRYEGFDQDERGILRGEPRVAWFTDPAGTILAVMDSSD